MNQSKTQHWSKMSETGTKLGIKILLWAYTLLGKRGFRLLLRPVIFYYWLFSRKHRHASEQYLSQLKQYYSEQDINYPIKLTSFNHLTFFAESLLNKIIGWRGDIKLADVNFHLPTTMKEPQNLKRAILLGSHLGDLELCRALSTHIPNIKVTALVFTKHAVQFNSILEQQQKYKNPDFELLQVDEISPATLFLLQQRLEEDHLIVIVGDRTSINSQNGNSDILINFLGKPAKFPQGPYVLAHLLKVPVYQLFVLRHPEIDGKFDLFLELFADKIELPRRARKDNEVITQYIEKYAERLQYYCYRSPLEWFNFFDFWQK